MKTAWQVRRTSVPQPDAERRWDYAYQFLLHWAMEPGAGRQPTPALQQEDPYGSRSVRSGLNVPAATATDN
jgi:hypothetical protein